MAADKAFEKLRMPGVPSYFIRVDSTNGTADSLSYMTKIPSALETKFASLGYAMEATEDKHRLIHVDRENYVISHKIMTFTHPHHPPKTLYLEGRGNPPWVPAIEKGTYADESKGEEYGGRLVANSLKASNETLKTLSVETGAPFKSAPDLSMLCCTHYPPIKKFLQEQYGDKTEYLNQATIVRDIVGGDITSRSGEDPQIVADVEAEPLDLVITIGSQNEGGVTVPINKMQGTRSDIPKSIEDPGKTREMLGTVIETIRQGEGKNAPA